MAETCRRRNETEVKETYWAEYASHFVYVLSFYVLSFRLYSKKSAGSSLCKVLSTVHCYESTIFRRGQTITELAIDNGIQMEGKSLGPYVTEGRWFDPRWCHGIFHWHKSFWSHYGPGVDSASNRNEYQVYFMGVNAAGA
jgi:hypothetical protein